MKYSNFATDVLTICILHTYFEIQNPLVDNATSHHTIKNDVLDMHNTYRYS